MKHIILALALLAFSSCAMIAQKEMNDKVEQKAKEDWAATKALFNDPLYGDGMRALDEQTHGHAVDSIINIRRQQMERGDWTTTPADILGGISQVSLPVGVAAAMIWARICKTDSSKCDMAKRAQANADQMTACANGDGKACAERALHVEKIDRDAALEFAKKSCVFGNRGGCTLVGTYTQQQTADRSIAAQQEMNQAQINEARRQNALNYFNRPTTTCTSSKDYYGRVTTNCR